MLSEIYATMLEHCTDNDLTFLLGHRGIIQDYQRDFLQDYGIIPLTSTMMLQRYNNIETNKATGLFSDSGNCILKGRYIIPVTDITGELLTLIGWYPDTKKYITLPTPNFSKSFDWFNIHNAYIRSLDFGGLVFVVEGIFDTLMLAALGLPVVGAMGSAVGQSKGAALEVFERAIIIPDADEIGQKAMSRWKVPIPHTFVRIPKRVLTFSEGHKLTLKDPDDIAKYYPRDGLYELLLSFSKLPGTKRLETLDI